MPADGFNTKYRAEVLRGPTPGNNQVQVWANISDTVPFTLNVGTIVTLDANGDFVPGIPTGAGAANAAFVLMYNSSQSDTVATDFSGDWASDIFAYQPVHSRSYAIGVPVDPGYLFGISNYDETATYTPNMKLSATFSVAPADAATAGVARPHTGTEASFGVVQKDMLYSPYGRQNMLVFLGKFTPAT